MTIGTLKYLKYEQYVLQTARFNHRKGKAILPILMYDKLITFSIIIVQIH